jgi:hypothetical protein
VPCRPAVFSRSSLVTLLLDPWNEIPDFITFHNISTIEKPHVGKTSTCESWQKSSPNIILSSASPRRIRDTTLNNGPQRSALSNDPCGQKGPNAGTTHWTNVASSLRSGVLAQSLGRLHPDHRAHRNLEIVSRKMLLQWWVHPRLVLPFQKCNVTVRFRQVFRKKKKTHHIVAMTRRNPEKSRLAPKLIASSGRFSSPIAVSHAQRNARDPLDIRCCIILNTGSRPSSRMSALSSGFKCSCFP